MRASSAARGMMEDNGRCCTAGLGSRRPASGRGVPLISGCLLRRVKAGSAGQGAPFPWLLKAWCGRQVMQAALQRA